MQRMSFACGSQELLLIQSSEKLIISYSTVIADYRVWKVTGCAVEVVQHEILYNETTIRSDFNQKPKLNIFW